MPKKIETILNSSKVIRRCQRNWDLSKSIPDEHIKILAEVAKHSPSKQDEAYYDVLVITQRELIEELYRCSIGYWKALKKESWPNPQTRANIIFAWVIKTPNTMRNYYQPDDTIKGVKFKINKSTISNIEKSYSPGDKKDKNEISRTLENTYTSIGASMSVTAYVASLLGYSTGFNKNIGEFSKIINLDTKKYYLKYTLGIGYPQQDKPHNIDHENREFHSCSLAGDRDVDIIKVIKSKDKISYVKIR